MGEGITQREFDMAVAGINDRIVGLHALVDEKMETILKRQKCIEDHEDRIRFLERYAWIVIGAIAILELITRIV